jgi:hypothetical protein
MKKRIEGYLFNRIEKLGDRQYNHIGFEDKDKSFGDLLASFVPKIGMRKKARLTIEILNKETECDEKNKQKKDDR